MNLKKIIGIVIFCAGIIIIFFSGLYLFLEIKWNRELQITMSKLKEKGRFPSKQELIPKTIPSDINASSNFEAIFKIMTSGKEAKEFSWQGGQKYSKLIESLLSVDFPINSTTWDKANNNIIVKNLGSKEINSIISYLQKAETKPHLNFYLDYEAGPEMLLPHLDVIRKLYKVICLEALYLAHTNRLNTAYNLLLTGLKTSLLLQQEPIIISQLIRMTCDINLINTYKMLVFQYGIPNKTADKYLTELPKHNNIEPFLKVADTEMVFMGMFIYDGLLYENSKMALKQITNLLDNPLPLDYLPIFFIKPFIRKDYSVYLEQIADFKISLAIPYWKLSEEKLSRLLDPTSPPVYCFISKMIMPSLINLLKKITTYRTEIDNAILFTAIQMYKNKHKTAPKKISDLTHNFNLKVPIDYFTGKELIIPLIEH